jgi:PAS domain S-box-containing protein
MKIRTQLIAGIVVFAIILMIISGFTLVTNNTVEKLIDQEDVANSIALQVGELGYLSNDYIIYHEPEQVDRWNAKYAAIAVNISQLSVDPPEQQMIAGTLAANLRNTKSVFDDIASAPPPTGSSSTAFIQLSWTRMAVQNQLMIFDASRLADLLRAQADDLRQTRLLLILTLMGAFVALLLTSYFYFYRRTLMSIDSLQQGAAKIGAGDFSHTIDENSDDEIGELARSFNRMTADLRQVTARKVDLETEVVERMRVEADLAYKNEELGELNEELTSAHDELIHANAQLAAHQKDLVDKNDELHTLNEELSSAHEELQKNLNELTRAEGELRSSEERYRNLFEKMTEGFAVHEIICDETGKPVDYRFLEINPAFEQLTGLKRSDIVGRCVSEILPGIEKEWVDQYGSEALTGKPVHFDNYSAPLDRFFEVFSYAPAQGQFAALFSDITARKKVELNQKIMEEILRILNRGGDLHVMIGEILAGIKKATGFDAVGLRLREDEDYPYYVQSGFSDEFVKEENSLCSYGADGSPIRISGGRIVLECTCGSVISGKTDPTMPCFTEGGSFWTNKSSDLLDLAPGDDPRTNPRNRCIHKGYQSFALVPVRSGETILGLLQMNDRREGMFSPESIRFFEALGDNLGLALERSQAETALRTSEHRLRETTEYLENLITYANAPIVVWDPELRITRFNNAFELLTGMPTSDVLGHDLGVLFPEEYRAASMDVVRRTTRGERMNVVELPILHRNGDVRTVLWNSATLYEADGKTVSSTIAQGQDITERKKAEDALRESEQKLRETGQYLENLITYANAPIVVWDPEFRITRFNRAFERLTGRPADAVIGQPLGILFPDDQRSELMTMIHRTLTGERWEAVEIPAMHVSGEVRTVLWNSATLYGADGKTITSIIAQGQDITDRKKAEEALRETSEYLENLITYANAPIMVWDPGFHITRFNRAFERLTGRTAEEMIGHRLETLFPGETLFDSVRRIKSASLGDRMESVEIPIRHTSGEVRTVLWNSAIIFGSDGSTIVSTIAQGQDITERKRAEQELVVRNSELNAANEELSAIYEELSRANRELYRRNEDLGSLNEELTSTQEELQQNVDELSRNEEVLRQNEAELKEALEEKEILLSEIHHRVKNNLTAFISLLSLEGSYEDSPEGHGLKKDLQNRARSMALIHETLYRTKKYSRVDMGVYLTTLIEQIATSYTSATSIRTIVDADGTTIDIARATPCGLIINELITNSFKYAFPESFDCTAERGEPCTIRVTLKNEGGTYVLRVSDNGIGLPGGLDIRTTQSLGLKLVNFLARHQLRAAIEISGTSGTEFIFRFNDMIK